MACSFQLTQAQKSLIGIMIIKFATGFTSDWGVISLYVLSYYHFRGAPLEIKSSTNSLLMILLVIPVTICLIIATKVSLYFGHERLIRFCAIAYLILPLLSFLSFRFEIFVFCNLLAPCSAFALSLVPIFHCLYSHYGNNKSLATGAVICSFGLGAIVWNLVATLAINPENTIPDIPTQDPNLQFFDVDIASKVPRTLNYIYLISGFLFLGGAYLITQNKSYKDSNQHAIDLNIDHQLNEEEQNQIRNGMQLQKANEISIKPTGEMQGLQTKDKNPIDVKKYLKHPIVILLFLMNITGCLFQVYVQLNTKLVYMPILQDDHLISVGLILIILSSALFSVPWGLMADRQGPPCTIITFIIIDLTVKIFACIARSKTGFVLSMIFIGGTDKTMLVLFAPILIDSFGLRVATELLPFKGISGIFSVIVAAALGLVFSGMPPERALYVICAFSFINLALGIYLSRIIRKKQKENQELKQIQKGQSMKMKDKNIDARVNQQIK